MKRQQIFSFILFVLFTLTLNPTLEGARWGKANETNKVDEIVWNGVYCELEGLSLTACVPHYSGGSFQNGEVFLRGKIDENIGYVITTSYNPGFNPPSSLEAFYELVQKNNLEHTIVAIDAKAFGAKYVLDLIPINEIDTPSWRFLCTEDRLIKMGTDDNDNARRTFFFDSISITDGEK